MVLWWRATLTFSSESCVSPFFFTPFRDKPMTTLYPTDVWTAASATVLLVWLSISCLRAFGCV